MKKQWTNHYLPCLICFLGGLGWLGRLTMYRFAMEEQGLLAAGFHPAKLFAAAPLVAAAAILLFHGIFHKVEQPLTGPAWLPALGCFAFAAGLTTASLNLVIVDVLEITTRILGLAAAAGQLWTGICHLRGKKPFFAGDALSSLFFAFFLVCNYHIWSGNPHGHQYFLYTAALILLASTAWYRAAHATDLGWSKQYYPIALGTVVVCLAGIPLSGAALLLTTGSFWAVSGLYRPGKETASGPKEA